MVNTDFTNFGVNKIIIITALIDGYQYNFHPNTILTNNTTFEEYYSPFSLLPSPLRARVGAGVVGGRWSVVGGRKTGPDRTGPDRTGREYLN